MNCFLWHLFVNKPFHPIFTFVSSLWVQHSDQVQGHSCLITHITHITQKQMTEVGHMNTFICLAYWLMNQKSLLFTIIMLTYK